jgi:hypothetical protein
MLTAMPSCSTILYLKVSDTLYCPNYVIGNNAINGVFVYDEAETLNWVKSASFYKRLPGLIS